MTKQPFSIPQFFKGIALFTPGGDLVYSIDPNKQARWHLHLCLTLQEVFGLSEPPYFLLPGHTATIDRWQNQHTGKIEICTEFYPAVARYLPLLQVLFGPENSWQAIPWTEEYCNPEILEPYRQEFPQLWEARDLIIRLDPDNPYPQSHSLVTNMTHAKSTKSQLAHLRPGKVDIARPEKQISARSRKSQQQTRGYVLLLFIASNNIKTNETLDSIHYILETGLASPYNLKIIDITKNPEQAEKNQVSATPTLVRIWPKPIKRIVGELTDLERAIKIMAS